MTAGPTIATKKIERIPGQSTRFPGAELQVVLGELNGLQELVNVMR